MASVRLSLNVTPNEELRPGSTPHRGISYTFLDVAHLPKKKKTVNSKIKKNNTLRGPHIHIKKTMLEEMRSK
jgi:hypothetical protein